MTSCGAQPLRAPLRFPYPYPHPYPHPHPYRYAYPYPYPYPYPYSYPHPYSYPYPYPYPYLLWGPATPRSAPREPDDGTFAHPHTRVLGNPVRVRVRVTEGYLTYLGLGLGVSAYSCCLRIIRVRVT